MSKLIIKDLGFKKNIYLQRTNDAQINFLESRLLLVQNFIHSLYTKHYTLNKIVATIEVKKHF
jgi:hypothetical protein